MCGVCRTCSRVHGRNWNCNIGEVLDGEVGEDCVFYGTVGVKIWGGFLVEKACGALWVNVEGWVNYGCGQRSEDDTI